MQSIGVISEVDESVATGLAHARRTHARQISHYTTLCHHKTQHGVVTYHS